MHQNTGRTQVVGHCHIVDTGGQRGQQVQNRRHPGDRCPRQRTGQTLQQGVTPGPVPGPYQADLPVYAMRSGAAGCSAGTGARS